jgi:exopolysaccharide biosynthesis polyprenyl glycosylphosphotransferase
MNTVLKVCLPTRTVLLAVSEASLIFVTLTAATFAGLGYETGVIPEYGNELARTALASAVFLLCMYYYDLYDSSILTNSREILSRLVQVLGTACLILAFLYLEYPDIGLGIRIFLGGTFLVGLLLAGWRRLFFTLSRLPGLAERAVVLGEGSLATSLAAELERRPGLGLRLAGYVGNPQSNGGAVKGLPCLGDMTDFAEAVTSRQIGRVIVTTTDRSATLPVDSLLRLKTAGVQIQDGAEVYEVVTGKVLIDSTCPNWLLFSARFPISPWMRLYKGIFSFVLSFAALVLSLPVMGLIALAVWLDSGSPVIFRQTRVGENGNPFTLYKFRSMHKGASSDGSPKPAQWNDARCTRVGRWLRRTRLDEFPQLYNILRGDMYFVGPRPFVPEEEAESVRKIPFYSQRWSVRPGATGWAQVQRGYCVTLEDNAEKLAYDLFYIKHMSAGLDAFIMFMTIKTLLLGRGAQ